MSGLVIDIRRAQPSDAQSLSDAYAASWEEAYCGIIPAVQLKRMIARRGARWWQDAARRRRNILVLGAGDNISGYATFGPARMDARMDGSADAGEIQELYLAPEYQGIGLGVRLFEAACAALRRQDYKRVIARSLEENDRALRFYERRGGKAVGRIEETIGGKTMPQIIYEWAL
jgi:ribosomal protein S18 acetylase RimI-like enzyme